MKLPDTLQKSILYEKLKQISETGTPSETKNSRKALVLIEEICKEASDVMKKVPTLFPEYTLHDDKHLLKVTEIMGIIINESQSLQNLNYIEMTILILSAYLHDIGMVVPKGKIEQIVDSDDFSIFRAKKQSELEGIKEYKKKLKISKSESSKKDIICKIAEIEQSILTNYLRDNHGEFGAEYIIKKWGDDARWELENHNISEIVALVCKSHCFKAMQLNSEYSADLRIDKIVGGTSVNMLYCSIILRLADILDFDRERTPNILYENISPQNNISINEWNKHRSVTGWKISKDNIIYECECVHPVYEKAVREFLDYIDYELKECRLIIQDFPKRDDIADRYQLKLPVAVDRSRITAKNNSYSYIDLSFTLSHEEIFSILINDDFWDGKTLVIRELIQNAYDAIRHRRAIEKAAGNTWNDGEITLIQRINDENKLELVCIDNGMGMDKYILENFFFKIGKSYYRSPEFAQERAGLKSRYSDFDPVSQFGIGIASTFMIGKSLKIYTQRYLGHNKGCGEALEVDVNGFSRMVIIKKSNNQTEPGTKIIVVGKKISNKDIELYAKHPITDPLRLLEATQLYAAALDIPIKVIVEEPFAKCNEIVIPPSRPLKLKTEFEIEVPSEHYTIIEKDLSTISKGYEGTVRIPFLINSKGHICIKNKWGKWKRFKENNGTNKLVKSDGNIIATENQQRLVLSQDGILLCYEDRKRSHLMFTQYPAPLHYNFLGNYFCNLSGAKKLPLKANRAPCNPTFYSKSDEEEEWEDFKFLLKDFILEIVEEIISNEDLRPSKDDFWSIISIYKLQLYKITKNTAYKYVPIPFIDNNQKIYWKTLHGLNTAGVKYISLSETSESRIEHDIAYVPFKKLNANLINSYPLINPEILEESIKSILRLVSVLQIKNDKILFEINPLETPFNIVDDTHYRRNKFRWEHFILYGNSLKDYIYVHNPSKGVNYGNPLIKKLIFAKDNDYELNSLKYGIKTLIFELSQIDEFFTKEPEEWSDNTPYYLKNILDNWSDLEWDNLPDEFNPPYKLLCPKNSRKYHIYYETIKKILERSKYKEEPHERKLEDLS
ncbi:MAG: ATP-binding protein [Methanobacterium sp.]